MEEKNVQTQPTEQAAKQMPPKTWLLESILITVFCCLPLGIIGIVNASKVETRFYAGDMEAANEASENAKKWTLWGLGIGIVIGIAYAILMALGVFAGIMGNL